jgi:chromosome segregation ATPase
VEEATAAATAADESVKALEVRKRDLDNEKRSIGSKRDNLQATIDRLAPEIAALECAARHLRTRRACCAHCSHCCIGMHVTELRRTIS